MLPFHQDSELPQKEIEKKVGVRVLEEGTSFIDPQCRLNSILYGARNCFQNKSVILGHLEFWSIFSISI